MSLLFTSGEFAPLGLVIHSYDPISSGTYRSAKAVWPIFQQQKYGRIITTCSAVGICESV
jgi:hypothetical protein